MSRRISVFQFLMEDSGVMLPLDKNTFLPEHVITYRRGNELFWNFGIQITPMCVMRCS